MRDLPFTDTEIGEALGNFATGIQVQGSHAKTGHVATLLSSAAVEVLGYLVADVKNALPPEHQTQRVEKALHSIAIAGACIGITAQRRRNV